ncbi:M48 family metallopeptidase [Couchioplanes caeruleus]|uniref:Peptidase n=1 Tax=Couchioplanes caeruleus subsp. caeruleus TaxID=56427 RepID=A0A1K0FC69_9ACTN|nr:M48 family metallopeptidase [Couchioplanes caeruleus]OJF10417.1 peptidase [Couchioplanes caeruleus subsp. caeruleus]
MQKRVWASIAGLAGFLVVAASQLALVVTPVMLVLSTLPGAAVLRIGLPVCIATVGVMGYATWRALHLRRPEPVGIPVTRTDAPELWSLLDGAAGVAGTRAPDRLTIVADAAVKVIERTRLLGLAGGHRDLYLGLPLLQAWDTARLKAAVAHEIGHFSPRGGRLAPIAYRGRIAVGRVVPRIPRRNPAGPLLRAYARFYRRVDAPFSAAQELQADLIAAEYAGAGAAAAVLRDLPALDGMLRIFHAEYLGPGWQAGHVPEDVFGGFLRMLAARAEEVAVLRAREVLRAGEPAAPSRWDTHPARADRLAALAALAALPGSATPAEDSSSAEAPAALELIPDLPGLGRALQTVAFPAQGRTAVGWDEFFGAARVVEMEREAEVALTALSRVAGNPIATAADVLDLAAEGRLPELAESVFPDLSADETASRIADLVTLLLALAALRSGAARWRHSWTGTAELVAPDGAHLNLGELAALAVDPATVATVRERLTALGIDVSAGPATGVAQPRAEVVGGVVNLLVDGARTDVLVVDTGLVLVPGLPRSQNGSAKRRLAEFAAADIPRRTAIAPESRFVAYADVAGATQVKRRSWDIRLRDGATLSVRAAFDSGELPGGWTAWDEAVAFLSRTR